MNSDNIIINLKMISKIPKFGRVYCTKYNDVVIQTKSFFSGIQRFIQGANRNSDIAGVMTIINDSFKMNYYFLENKDARAKESIKMILLELNNSVKGLEMLRTTTYKDDYNICCLLELTITKITSHIDEMIMKSGVEKFKDE